MASGAEDLQSIVGTIGDLFGTTTGQSGTTIGSSTATQRESLEIDDEAVDKILNDLLSEAGGLKDIFAGEQSAGIFDSSVAAQAAGDFASKVVGEIAKLRAVKVTEQEASQESTTSSKSKDKGVLDGIGDFFGF